MATISKVKRDKIVDKAVTEIQFARNWKQGIIWRWWKNEDLYYGKRDNVSYNNDTGSINQQNQYSVGANANIASAKTMSFVETMLSKIDSPLTFKYIKPTMADYKRAKLLNALKDKDANEGDWNYKDLLGKTDAIIYGRAIYSYHADSYDGYCSYLEYVGPYDFLIDPSGGGFDLDKAMYMGRYGIRKTRYELEKGMKAGDYIKTETQQLLNGSGNDANQTSQEDTNKQNKYAYIGSPGNRTIQDTDVYKLWEWYTTFEGERYYVLMQETSGIAIKVCKLTDLFKTEKKLGDAMWPFWSYAYTPNATEFWTPSKMDYVREIFMAQSVSINQMLENGERINKPQRGIDVTSIENIADLIYKRNGVIRMKGGVDINKAFKIVETPSINTPILVYNTLEGIQQLESGITAAAKGISQEDKVGIYEGNQANTADRYGVWNKSYAQGYKRFAVLYKNGIEDNLTVKVAVKVLGTSGLEETIFVSKRDLKPQADWSILVESTNAEAQADAADKRNKLTFMNSYRGDPIVNQKMLFEQGAELVGFNNDEVRQFLDATEYGEADLISEAERDMEDLLNKKIIEPNERANSAYATHILNYMKDHKEDMDNDTFMLFQDYLTRIEPIVVRNMGTQLTNQLSAEGASPGTPQTPIQPEVQGQTEGQLTTNEPNQITNTKYA